MNAAGFTLLQKLQEVSPTDASDQCENVDVTKMGGERMFEEMQICQQRVRVEILQFCKHTLANLQT